MVTHEEVGRRIREAREELGLSQADLGRRLARPRTHAAISDIERGKTKLDIEELSEFAVVLGKDLAYFVEPRPAPAIVYRQGERGLTREQQRETDRAVEAFKRFAREQAQQKTQGSAR